MLQIWDLVSQELHGKGTNLPLLEVIFADELSAVQVSISLPKDYLLCHVALAVSSGTTETFCDNPPAAKYVLVAFLKL